MRAFWMAAVACFAVTWGGCSSVPDERLPLAGGAPGLQTGGTAGGAIGGFGGAGGSTAGAAATSAGSAAISGAGTGGALGAAGAAGAAGSAPSEPRPVIDNTVLWLEAAEAATVMVENGRVSKWQDLSGSHNDATQATEAARPTLSMATDALPAALHFEVARKTFLGVNDAPSLQWGKGDFTVAVVFAFTNRPFAEGSPGVHLGGWAFTVNKITQPSGPRVGWGIMGNWPNGETSPVRTAVGCETTEAGGVVLTKQNGYNDGVLRLWVMRRVTARGIVELRENGTVNGTAKGGPFLDGVDAIGTAITIGGARMNPGNQNTAGFNLDGDVAAVVAVKGTLADAQLATLEQYLMKKYRTTKP